MPTTHMILTQPDGTAGSGPALLQAKPCNFSKKEISRLAEVFARAVKFVPGGEMTPVAERLGGKIEYLPWEEWSKESADSIEVFGRGKFTIFLSKIAGLFNNRFSIAHELGHYVLHSNMGETRIVAQRNYKNTRVEWEANWFAGSLLMPEEHFRREALKNSDPHVLAAKYLVSPTAAKVRMEIIFGKGSGKKRLGDVAEALSQR